MVAMVIGGIMIALYVMLYAVFSARKKQKGSTVGAILLSAIVFACIVCIFTLG
ncbi:MAG: hypothetical protein KIG43_08620 [Eubacteriales bacterium]|nr:hypothetical protein [Eubacteriales bacterium]MCI7570294.1 hypothetical protein [Clostridiales bacterium]MDY5755009.1 hypothetical protein [Eubacteriales bacterium]